MPKSPVKPRKTERGNCKRKSLQVLLRQYRKSCKSLQDALNNMSDQEDIATIDAAHGPTNMAREAMIAAPVVSLDDVATKLRFYLEVGSGSREAGSPCFWEVQIVKGILRDLDRQKSARGIMPLRGEWIAALKVYHEATQLSVQRALGSTQVDGRLEPELAGEAARARFSQVTVSGNGEAGIGGRCIELGNKLADTAAYSLDDIGLKLSALATLGFMHDEPNAGVLSRLVFGLMRDIERMTGTKIPV